MLEIRPNCEYCDCDLPPQSTEARICSYECTFCANCVDKILFNVCPNCGGGFEARPIRPSTARRKDIGLAYHPASTKRRHLNHDRDEVALFVKDIHLIDPSLR